jgi:hypothetical protein
VNNAGSGERIHLKLKSSEPRHRKVGNGMEDSWGREGPAATGGEKPLKGGAHGRTGMKYGWQIRDAR